MPMYIDVYLYNDSPNKLRRIKHGNAVVHIFPREQANDFWELGESQRTGVYILVGSSIENSQYRKIYIGQTDRMGDRIRQHYSQRLFWNEAICCTSSDDNINISHTRYIEAKLYELARGVLNLEIDNQNPPYPPNIGERDRHIADMVMEEMILLMNVVGIGLFDQSQNSMLLQNRQNGVSEIIFILENGGARAKMKIQDNKYIVLEGSTVRKELQSSATNKTRILRGQLLNDAILCDFNDELYRFTSDYEFKSSSAAGAFITGNSVNGNIVWKYNGQLLKDFLDRN